VATINQKVHGIIHTAAVACAGVGGGLAQVPGADAEVIIPIQTTMITAIAYEHGVTLTKAAVADLILTYTATMGGRFLSQVLVGWVPVLGNVINASTAAALTEAMGWAADAYFEKAQDQLPPEAAQAPKASKSPNRPRGPKSSKAPKAYPLSQGDVPQAGRPLPRTFGGGLSGCEHRPLL